MTNHSLIPADLDTPAIIRRDPALAAAIATILAAPMQPRPAPPQHVMADFLRHQGRRFARLVPMLPELERAQAMRDSASSYGMAERVESGR